MEIRSQEDQANYDRALLYAANPPISQKYLDNSTETKFDIIQKDFAKEYAQLRDFLDGKLEMDIKTYFTWYYNKLFYIEFPDFFERDIAGIYDELNFADKAWVNNTRIIIENLHPVVIEQELKVWPQMALIIEGETE